MTPRKGYNLKKYREGFDEINWGKNESIRTPLAGDFITHEEAYKGLGDPKTWDDDEKRLITEFNKKPTFIIGKFIAPNIKNIKIEAGDGFRKCQFCGCNTNAKLRRCCNQGYETDLAQSNKKQKMFGKQVTELSCFTCNGRGTVVDFHGDDNASITCPTCQGEKTFSAEEWKKLLDETIKGYDREKLD